MRKMSRTPGSVFYTYKSNTSCCQGVYQSFAVFREETPVQQQNYLDIFPYMVKMHGFA
jgi:hypothetical protein